MQANHFFSVMLIVEACLCLPCEAGQAQTGPPDQALNPDAAIHDIIHSDTYPFSIPLKPSNTDADGDGIIDVAFFVPAEHGRLVRGGDLNVLATGKGLRLSNLGPNGSGSTEILAGAPINHGGQLLLAANGRAYNANFSHLRSYVVVWNPQTRHVEKTLFLPPPPSSSSPVPDDIYQSYSLGDLDDDNHDELLVFFSAVGTSDFLGCSVVDGATLSYKWSKYYATPLASNIALYNAWPDPCQDIDGDGIKDILLVTHSDFSPASWYSRCISGVDGSVIWEDVRPTGDSFWATGSASVIDDVNQDGIRDLFFYNNSYATNQHPGYFRVQSGQDGSLIWEVPISDYDPDYSENPPSSSLRFHREALPTADLDGDGVREIVIKGEVSTPSGWPPNYLYYLSGATGQLLSRDKLMPVSPYPWSNSWTLDSRALFLGDIDNDGWAEFLNYTDAANSDSVTDLAIIGRSTLVCPQEAREGDTVRFNLHIPTGSGKTFRIFLSTAFDTEDSGFHLGTWNTHLAPSPLLLASRFLPKLQGTLDQNGKGSLSVRVPAGLGLVGQEIFAVGVVEDAAMPSGVVTKSTVGVITILP
jgi:hypothetical protein